MRSSELLPIVMGGSNLGQTIGGQDSQSVNNGGGVASASPPASAKPMYVGVGPQPWPCRSMPSRYMAAFLRVFM